HRRTAARRRHGERIRLALAEPPGEARRQDRARHRDDPRDPDAPAHRGAERRDHRDHPSDPHGAFYARAAAGVRCEPPLLTEDAPATAGTWSWSWRARPRGAALRHRDDLLASRPH